MAIINQLQLFLFCACASTCIQVGAEKTGRFIAENGETRQWISSASRFKRCCGRRPAGYEHPRMRKPCRQLCSYDTFNDQSKIVNAFMTGTCNAPELKLIIYCGSRFEDHKDCCQAAGVTPNCLSFCRPAYEEMEAGPESMVCLSFMPKIKKCFEDFDRANQLSGRVG